MKRSNAVEILAVPGIPLVRKDDDLVALIGEGLARGGIVPRGGDVFVLTQKIVSKAEGRMVDLATVEPSAEAIELAGKVQKDPRLVELILSESVRVVRARPGILIVEHRLGFVMANAGIDQSNVASPDEPQRALLLPVDPDGSAAILRARLSQRFGVPVAVIISDSFGRAWRRGTCGVAIGAAGLPSLMDLRGSPDLFGRDASGQHHRACGRDRRCGVAGDGAGRRRPACRGRARSDMARSRQWLRPSWCARPPRTCSDEQATCRGAVRRRRRRQTGARSEPRLAGRRTARGRQHRRRFRASWTEHLARYRHADLCSRWHRQSRHRLGPA